MMWSPRFVIVAVKSLIIWGVGGGKVGCGLCVLLPCGAIAFDS